MIGLFVNSLLLAAAVILIAAPIGTAIAAALAWWDWPGRRWSNVLILVPLFLPLYLQAAAWDAVVGRQGWLAEFAGPGGIPALTGWTAAIVVHSLAALPWVVLIVGLSLRQVEPAVIEQARLDLPEPLVVWAVVRARAWPALVLAAAWIAVLVAGEMTVADMYQVPTFARDLYSNFALDRAATRVLTSVGPGLLTIAVGLAVAVGGTSLWRPGGPATTRDLVRRPYGGVALAVGSACLLLALLGVPLASLVYKAGVTVEMQGDRWLRGWSWGKLAAIVADTPVRFRDEFLWTGLLAGLAATLATMVALPGGWWARHGGWRAGWVLVLGSVVLAIPGPLFALLLIVLRDAVRLDWLDRLCDQSLFFPAVVLAGRAVPICLVVAWHGWRGIPRDMLEVAQLDGLSTWRQFLAVALPQRRATIAVCWLTAWVVAAGDVTSSILLVPPRVSTVSLRTFQLIHAGVDDRLAGLCLVSAAVFALLAWCVLRLGASDSSMARRTP